MLDLAMGIGRIGGQNSSFSPWGWSADVDRRPRAVKALPDMSEQVRRSLAKVCAL